ncbi:MAG: response regulator transcription factor [Kangiellaceae bacterium]|jgi:two-component system, OmpR family, response regulator CpxR
MNIIIADDDIELCNLLKQYLENENMSVDICHNGQDAVEKISQNEYNLLILDVMMPVLNGFDALSNLRKSSDLPVIMLTAKGEKIDRIVGLEMGADDYVAKPCDPRELVARIRAITRRTHKPITSAVNNEETSLGDIQLSHSTRVVKVSNKVIELTSTEFDFLERLLSNAGNIVTREQLSREVLGKRLQAFDRSIDMHISNLRKKLGERQDGLERIKTIRGNGYQLLK